MVSLRRCNLEFEEFEAKELEPACYTTFGIASGNFTLFHSTSVVRNVLINTNGGEDELSPKLTQGALFNHAVKYFWSRRW